MLRTDIASISTIEGKNWRHGDIEDTLKALAFIKGHKFSAAMIKRVYFGNWLRDYSQALDVGTLVKVKSESIRILVWVLSFMSFGYATAEFEVTSERLGVYRPEEHIDNPKDYADNKDARTYDARLRGPVRPIELQIDMNTGMKNYIANERGDWATSAGFVRYSFARSIHFGRLYRSGGHSKGRDEDLYEALRCLGQGLHTLEDFSAHSNYVELVLREMGHLHVFPHTGVSTMMNIRGHHVFPIVTGTFGTVDFLHSVLGEATDHFAQSEINEVDTKLNKASGTSASNSQTSLIGLLSKVPGAGDLISEAQRLKTQSDAQAKANEHPSTRSYDGGYGGTTSRGDFNGGHAAGYYDQSRAPAPSAPSSGPLEPDPQETIAKIYPILEFRDKVVRRVSACIEKIPGLSSLLDKISETVTIFVYSLLAPYIRPLIQTATTQLHSGSSGVIEASGQHQYEPWTDPHCTDPTHSLLSKDHFSCILNEPAGNVAAAVVKYVVPRILYAWEHANVPVERVLDECVHVFHHPALRDRNNEAHRAMYEAVEHWARTKTQRGVNLDKVLNSENVRAGANHAVAGHGHGHHHAPPAGMGGHGGHAPAPPQPHQQQPHSQGPAHSLPAFAQNIPGLSQGLSHLPNIPGFGSSAGNQHKPPQAQHSTPASGAMPWDKLSNLPIPGMGKVSGKLSSFLPGGRGGGGTSRELPTDGAGNDNPSPSNYDQQQTGYQPDGGSYDNISASAPYYDQQQPAYTADGGNYDNTSAAAPYYDQQQPVYAQEDTSFNVPPPAGYEQYQQFPGSDGQAEYVPPPQGPHTYDYYSYQPPPQGGPGYGNPQY
jgi:hypothetical protein